MPSDLQITNIKDQANANSAITIASDGQITVNQNNPTLTLGTNTTFPKGVSRGVNYLMQLQTSGTSVGGTLGGIGVQVVPFNTIKAGTEDSAFTQDILSLSSNKWTMNTGYYLWEFSRVVYLAQHTWLLGIFTHGDNTGSGSSESNVTTDNVNFGSMFFYVNPTDASGELQQHQGILKVTHTTQKYVFNLRVEADNQHSQSTYTHSSSHALIQQYLRFIRIGDI